MNVGERVRAIKIEVPQRQTVAMTEVDRTVLRAISKGKVRKCSTGWQRTSGQKISPAAIERLLSNAFIHTRVRDGETRICTTARGRLALIPQ